jgi:excisionase family DNA binding protein
MNTNSIKALIYAKPFYPFTLFLKNRSTYNITVPESCWVSPFGVYVVHSDPQALEILDPNLLEKVQTHPEITKRASAKNQPIPPRDNGNSPKERFSHEQLTVKEVAERLRVHQWTVYMWARTGRLPCIRLSKRSLRFLKSDIDKYERLHTTGRIRELNSRP